MKVSLLKLVLLSLSICLVNMSLAAVTNITNSILTGNFVRASIVPIFKGRANVIRINGSWIDLTNRIVAEGMQGQPNFNISVGNKQGGNDPWVEFTLNSNRDGKYRIRLTRPGLDGEDIMFIRYTEHISIATTTVLTTEHDLPAYLNAFPLNGDVMIRITGTNVDAISFRPVYLLNFYSSIQTIGTPTATQKDFKIHYSMKSDKVDIQQRDFVFTWYGKEYLYSDYKGNSAWSSGSLPYFRIYERPDFKVSELVTGIYNRKTPIQSCAEISSPFFVINNPNRCVTEFNMANPTAANPLVEKSVKMPDVAFTIINDSYAPQGSPITVHVKVGINILGVLTINRMIAQERRVIYFRRPNIMKKFVRYLYCPECYELDESPFSWTDPTYTVVVDPENTIMELNDTNNTMTFLGTSVQ